VVIKNTMFFCSNDKKLQEQFDTIFSLIDTIISKCSAKQSEIIYYKLLGFNEREISEKLHKYQSTISQHSTAAGWISIEKAVNYFENTIP
jgi:iron uptake system EfeUOB component EfeO/EfeM